MALLEDEVSLEDLGSILDRDLSKNDTSYLFDNGPYFGYDSPESAEKDCYATSQLEAYCRMLAGQNVFISGPAGSGKSSIIKPFVDNIERLYPNVVIAKTGTTGVSAVNIGGVTIHSFAGLMQNTSVSRYPGQAMYNLSTTDVLIIDEISMLPAYMFDLLNERAQRAKGNKLPFGGIQLILLGDFMQLPPIKSADEDRSCDYPITSIAWRDGEIHNLYMDKVRRASDPNLQKVLFEISRGKVSKETMSLLRSRMGDGVKDPNKTYTTLFCKNKNIDAYNKKKLDEIQSPLHTFETWTKNENVINYLSEEDQKTVRAYKKRHGLDTPFEVKVGATVVFTMNTIFGANGTIAKVVDIGQNYIGVVTNEGKNLYVTQATYACVKKVTKSYIDPDTKKKKTYREEKHLMSFAQFPLRLAFAISVHKSQGQTYDGVVTDLSDVFMPGLGYVALSRVRSLDDLVITGFKNLAVKVGERSLMLSRFVKKEALKNREDFVDRMSWYVSLMEDNDCLNEVWEPIDSRAEQLRENYGYSQ